MRSTTDSIQTDETMVAGAQRMADKFNDIGQSSAAGISSGVICFDTLRIEINQTYIALDYVLRTSPEEILNVALTRIVLHKVRVLLA